MSTRPAEVLASAVARSSGIVISLPSGGMLRNHKSRFLGDDAGGIWVEGVPEDAPLIDDLIRSQMPLGISCKVGHEKLRFTATALRREPAYQISSQTAVEAVQITRPATIMLQQRRNDYRVRLNEGDGISSRVWRIADHVHLADRPSARAEVRHELRDLSAGGVGLILPAAVTPEPVWMAMGQRLRMELSGRDETHLLEGRVVFTQALGETGRQACGVAFQHLERDLEGRRKLAWLTRVVGDLQREEARRSRLTGDRKSA